MPREERYGCIFCRSGKEKEVARQLEQKCSGCRAVVAEKIRYRRSHGMATLEKVILFPGYVFFKCPPEQSPETIFPSKDVYRILRTGDGSWELQGFDREIAKQFVTAGGTIDISKAFYDGDRIRIKEGFLKQYEGYIVRVNHRMKTAQINVPLDGKIFSIWLGFEVLAPSMLN